jgi:formate-dependent phosphoribosylglycinamide formyltransferase (GAR transformylase)
MKKLAAILLSLTCFVSPVSAGCAWVIWQKDTSIHDGQTSTSWEIAGTDEAKMPCQNQAKVIAQRYAKAVGGKVLSGTDLVVTIEQEHTIVVFWCLPDTVDPRGNKGSKP